MDRICAHGSRTGCQRLHWRRLAGTVACVAVLLSLTSCPNPLPLDLALQATDNDGPAVVITSPQDKDFYQSGVTITGFVTDPNGEVTVVD